MEVTNELIDKLAQLSRLQPDPEKKETLRKDLQQMISFVEKLQEVDTTGVEPLLHLSPQINALREDRVFETIRREEALSSAARKDQEFFLVPKVIQKQDNPVS
jgi:aspartyl-tRNA(Asn)/glutamyl-tRNA(Gln) amidotransferase subunit C